jgi:tetratricopeptide (TPR) repeat protein
MELARRYLDKRKVDQALKHFNIALDSVAGNELKGGLHLRVAQMLERSDLYKKAPQKLAFDVGLNYEWAGNLASTPMEKAGLYVSSAKAYGLTDERALDYKLNMERAGQMYSKAAELMPEEQAPKARELRDEALSCFNRAVPGQDKSGLVRILRATAQAAKTPEDGVGLRTTAMVLESMGE